MFLIFALFLNMSIHHIFKDQTNTASPHRQRAVSQDRQNSHKHEGMRNQAAKIRSRSQAPTSRARSQISIPKDRSPEPRDHDQEDGDINELPLQIGRGLETENFHLRKNLRSPVSITTMENKRHEIDYLPREMNSRGRIRTTSEYNLKKSRVSIGQQLYSQFSKRSDGDTHRQKSLFDSPTASCSDKPAPIHYKYNAAPEYEVMKPKIPKPKGKGMQMKKSPSQDSMSLQTSNEEIMRKVHAFLEMSDEEVFQHLKDNK
ncbi:hypothetical protein EGW08_020113 [Elysia chlorotica]|uniref:Uncharacterized protein n=1 Tax=Elysia chlorotica TaxID=188477 RepID=A0A433SSC0_ELYCH|nr:hypothetical protein EGW08_020113 [Elysia chlorotica]